MNHKDQKINAYKVCLHVVNSVFIRAIGTVIMSAILSQPWFLMMILADVGMLLDLRRFVRKQITGDR